MLPEMRNREINKERNTKMNEKDNVTIAVREEIENITEKPQVEELVKENTDEDMVEQEFTEQVDDAIAENDEKVQDEEKVDQNETSKIKARAENEEEEAHFNKKKSACECFGYNEATTEKWIVWLLSAWYNIATVVWIIIGAFTFASINFIAKKLSAIFKSTWFAVIVAIVIYAVIALSPLWVQLLANINNVAV